MSTFDQHSIYFWNLYKPVDPLTLPGPPVVGSGVDPVVVGSPVVGSGVEPVVVGSITY